MEIQSRKRINTHISIKVTRYILRGCVKESEIAVSFPSNKFFDFPAFFVLGIVKNSSSNHVSNSETFYSESIIYNYTVKNNTNQSNRFCSSPLALRTL